MGGFRLVYDRKCQFTLHVVAPELIEKVGHTIQQAEELRVKILAKVSDNLSDLSIIVVMQGPEEYPEVIKIELFGLSDYFFLYEHECDVFDYQEMREH